jgi:hypothetical protein
MKIIIKTLSVLLILLSLIGGFSINGSWSFLYEFEFVEMPRLFSTGQQTMGDIIAWTLMLVAHCGITALPFITQKRYFRGIVISAPLLFILVYVAMATIFALLFLLPFIIVWIVALVLSLNHEPDWSG